MGTFIKKIYQSLDLLGNRIKNVRVDTQKETRNSSEIGTAEYNNTKDFAANKEYVDQVSKYDSPLVTKQKSSKVFDWVQNINNKTIKEVLEILLFPKIPPTYIDAMFDSLTVVVDNNQTPKINSQPNKYGTCGLKYLIYDDSERTLVNHFQVEVKLTPNDRISGIASQLVFKDSNDVELRRVTATDTDENLQLFDFDYQLTSDTKIYLERRYTAGKQVKKDTRNEDSPIANPNWTLTVNVTEWFHKYIGFEPCYLISDNITDFNSEFTQVTDFKKKNAISISAETDNIYDILIPENIILQDSTELQISVYNERNNLICKHLINTENAVDLIVDTVKYKVVRVHLGYFEKECKAYIFRH